MICYVFKRGKYFSGKLRLEHESRTSIIALKTTDKRIALQELMRRADERQKEHLGLLPPLSVRNAAKTPLAGLLVSFIADAEGRGCSDNTLSKYRNALPKLFTRCRWVDLRSVTARSFCEWRSSSGLKPKTVNDLLMLSRTFFRWLVHQRMALENPLAHVSPDKRPSQQFRRALSPAEAQRLVSVAPPHRAMVYLTILNTGLRRSEIRQLRVGDLELSGERPRFRVRATTSKNRRDAVLDLNAEFASTLRNFIPADAAPFALAFPRGVPKLPAFRGDLKRAGIPFVDDSGRRVDLHALRNTYGTMLTNSGAAPRVVMELMRHSDIKLTMKIYTDAAQLPLASAVSKLPKITLRKSPSGVDTNLRTSGGRKGSGAVAS